MVQIEIANCLYSVTLKNIKNKDKNDKMMHGHHNTAEAKFTWSNSVCNGEQ